MPTPFATSVPPGLCCDTLGQVEHLIYWRNIWSNLLLLLPLILSVLAKIYWFTALVALSMVFSIIYHIWESNFILGAFDKTFAIMLCIGAIILFIYLCFIPHRTWYLVIAAVIGVLAIALFVFSYKRGNGFTASRILHSEWHCAGALVVSIILLGYVVPQQCAYEPRS